MNKTVFYLAMAIMVVFFTDCNKTDQISENETVTDSYGDALIKENPLIVKVTNLENGKGDIAFAKFYVTYYSNGDWPYLAFSAKFENDGFELNFPATIPSEYLDSASNTMINEGLPSSDTQAKTVSVNIEAHNSSDEIIGAFGFVSDNWAIEFKYADRDFTEKGTSDYYGVEYDCSYKKGWNIVYWSLNGQKKHTTQKPLNETFKCHFTYLTAWAIKNADQ